MFINEIVMKNILENYEDLLVLDDFDDAIIGVSTKNIVIYSVDKMVKILMKDGIKDKDEALEYFEFNIEDAYVGEKTPIYMW